MSYIQSFKQKFPDKVTPEMIESFHGGKFKIKEFTYNSMLGNQEEVSGILFFTNENSARKKGPYVTKAMLKLNRLVSTVGPPRRDDIIYMLKNAPKKEELLSNFDKNDREAFFKAVDHIMKGGTAYNCYRTLSEEFYEGDYEEFAKNMVHIRYDGVMLLRGGEQTYIVFNPKCIQIVNQ
jgi:hypothetical protein